MNTSKYNHNTIGTETKPLIPNGELKKLSEHLKAGGTDENSWLEKWSLESYQKRFIEGLIADRDKNKSSLK